MTEQDGADVDGAHQEAATDGEREDADPATDGEREDEPAGIDAFDDVDRADVDRADLDDEGLDEALVDRVAESDPESVAGELAALRVRVDGLEDQLDAREEELEDVTEKLKRKQAEFQNYKKRMEKRREREKQRATEDLVERLLDVRDNLLRALNQEEADADDIREGVESTLRQFDRVLDEENVDVVEPEPGDEVDPHTHEVLMRVESDQPGDAIADVHRPGYVMAEKVIRPAQVTVSDGE